MQIFSGVEAVYYGIVQVGNDSTSPPPGGFSLADRTQARIQGRWNGWIFTPFFWAPSFFFSLSSDIEIIFDFSDFSDWGACMPWILQFIMLAK